MPVETAQYISDLNTAWPVATDQTRQGDDHLRLIKATLKNTFPNIDGPVELSSDFLNSLVGQLIPVGFFGGWYGTAENVPSGWAICDGRTVDRSDGTGTITTPDWRDKFIMGAGPKYPAGSKGGSASKTVTTEKAGGHTPTIKAAGAHAHGGATGAHKLTIEQIPSHEHLTVKSGVSTTALSGSNTLVQETTAGGDTEYRLHGVDGSADSGKTSAVGGTLGHSHTITQEPDHTHTADAVPDHDHEVTFDALPPYESTYIIMKV